MGRSRYRIHAPLAISFSGGRTSAYMLRKILDAYGGALPAHAHVLFANTGRERDETLNFVQACSERWGVPVVWLEYDGGGRDGEPVRWRQVDHTTAHRRDQPGSPFEKWLDVSPVLPNPVMRSCTSTLKTKIMMAYQRDALGWGPDFRRNVAIGIRSDESDRTIQILADHPSYLAPCFPMVDAGVTEKEVMAFWAKQPFNLGLRQDQGNCDFCFLKSRSKLIRLIRENPEAAEWWAKQEERHKSTPGAGWRFRTDRTYRGLINDASAPTLFDLDGLADDGIPCGCGVGPGDWRDDQPC